MFQVDFKKRERDAAQHWVEFENNARFLVSAWGSIEFVTAMSQYAELVPDENQEVDRIAQYDAMCYVMANTLLHGWENVYDMDGNDVEFSPEAAEQAFRNVPTLFHFIQSEAHKLADAQETEIENDSKKLSA